MNKRIVVLSGRIGSGKSALAKNLSARYGANVVSTSAILRRLFGEGADRTTLQASGARLDRDTEGKWLSTELRGMNLTEELVVVDSARTLQQIEAMRMAFPRTVVHVHLTAPDHVLRVRYDSRSTDTVAFADASADATERAVESLADACDVLIDSQRSSIEDDLVRTAARIGLYHDVGQFVDVLVGAQWGSEGKGHIAWFLAPEYDVLVRVGGPNAGHKVIDPPYTHRLLPSGTLANRRAQLLIGPGATVDPVLLLKEISECEIVPDRLSIDPQTMIIEQSDIVEETRTLAGIGSTKKGGGYAAARRLMRGGLGSETVRFARDVEELKPFVRPISEKLDDAYRLGKRVFVEGTQGTELSLYHGPYPFVTSRETTASGTLAEVGIAPGRVRKVILVTRSYPIRVANPEGGSSGDMPRELTWADVASRSGIPQADLEAAERTTVSNVLRRVSEFDWSLFRKACALNAPTDIALTFSDYVDVSNKNARRCEQLTAETLRFIDELERVATAPVSLVSTRFHARSIIDRRAW
ncbi:MAG: adenylosuccinate synthetase [Candidatus Eremiobacteraeota bacterium]|nr:adenylosuccinate synthetase [Candidatus Eremiobacteraeota bacterium]